MLHGPNFIDHLVLPRTPPVQVHSHQVGVHIFPPSCKKSELGVGLPGPPEYVKSSSPIPLRRAQKAIILWLNTPKKKRTYTLRLRVDRFPDPWADPKSRSTFGFHYLHHRSTRLQNWGINFLDPSGGLGSLFLQAKPELLNLDALARQRSGCRCQRTDRAAGCERVKFIKSCSGMVLRHGWLCLE